MAWSKVHNGDINFKIFPEDHIPSRRLTPLCQAQVHRGSLPGREGEVGGTPAGKNSTDLEDPVTTFGGADRPRKMVVMGVPLYVGVDRLLCHPQIHPADRGGGFSKCNVVFLSGTSSPDRQKAL